MGGDTDARVRAAFGDMGISVLNGMITSGAASIPLFFCQLQFFKKFGTFLCMVIAFSWVFANFAFMSLLAQLKIPIKEKEKQYEEGFEDDSDVLGVTIEGAKATKVVPENDGWSYERNPTAPQQPIKEANNIYETPAPMTRYQPTETLYTAPATTNMMETKDLNYESDVSEEL